MSDFDEQELIKTKYELIEILKLHNKLQHEGLALVKELNVYRKTLRYFIENGSINIELFEVIMRYYAHETTTEFAKKLEEQMNK